MKNKKKKKTNRKLKVDRENLERRRKMIGMSGRNYKKKRI
jgi:hypothetical protein